MFGEILKYLMEEKGITQNVLASNIGYTQRAVSKWVNNQSEPTETAIVKCAKYFNVTSDYLLGLEDETGTKTNISNSFNNFNNTGSINIK
jgi:transcriptional regulator with XRE-family HTH domain